MRESENDIGKRKETLKNFQVPSFCLTFRHFFRAGAVCWAPKTPFAAVFWPTHPCAGHLPKYTRLAAVSGEVEESQE